MSSGKRFFHGIRDATSIASIGTSYSVGNIHTLDLLPDWPSTESFGGLLEQLTMDISTIVTAASVTFKICSDAGGNNIVVPSTAVPIELGTADTTLGTCVVKIDIPVSLDASKVLYVLVKGDAGTFTLVKSTLVWSE